MGKKKDFAAIDKHLDAYQGFTWFTWWWNASDHLALAIASAARHIRKDASRQWDDVEREELKKIENYFYAISGDDTFSSSLPLEWLDAEAFYLLSQWFHRLWA